MRGYRLIALVAALACVAALGIATAAVTLDDFDRVLAAIPIVNEARVMAAFELGLKGSCCGFPVDETYRLLERLAAVPGSAADKEAIVLAITQAIEQGIPVDSLLNKAFEGLARAVPLVPLGQLLEQRLRLLLESRDLFYSRGIFRASPGAAVAVGATALPPSQFDGLLSNFGDALGDYLESGGSPFEAQQIYDEVHERLTQLSGSVLTASDVDLIFSRIEPADLTQVVLAALR
jgi:hypothetical protein